MTLTTTVELAFRADGWIHVIQDGYDVVRGPLGVLLYLAFVPLYGLVPRAYRSLFLILTSLLLGLATLGHGYVLTLAGLVLIGLGVVRWLATPARHLVGVGVLVAWFAALLLYPQPGWLPPVGKPELLYFYLHWAGIAYLFLKTLHVLADVKAGRMPQPKARDFLAYLLFAPTLRMGPIYRYKEFAGQLEGDPREYRSIRIALGRLVAGLLKLGIMAAVLDRFPLDTFFDEPWTLSGHQLLAGIYIAPLAFYLWLSGYIDLSVAVGRAMGFAVPENFNYPWRATNISEFWQRWHITLGSWLQDYIFTPLVRRRWHFFVSFTLTFLVCGLWHAPKPCYIIWGTAQGIGLGVRRSWLQYWKRQQRTATPLYRRLERFRLVRSPVPVILGWLITFHYEIVTIMIGMDFHHAGKLVFRRLVELVA